MAKGGRGTARLWAGFRRTIHARVVRLRPSSRLASPHHAPPGEAKRASARMCFPLSPLLHTLASA
jgi:hypothetical protein